MKYIIKALLLTTCAFEGYSQSIERYVFNSFGSATDAGGIQFVNNVGEPLTEGFFNQNLILTQGFLQPNAADFTLSLNENGAGKLLVWPNPSSEGLFVSFGNVDAGEMGIWIFDMNGKCLHTEAVNTTLSQQYLNLSSLANGSYLIQLRSPTKLYLETKFIKTSN